MMAVESPKALQDKLPRTFCKVCFTVRDNLHVKRERIGMMLARWGDGICLQGVGRAIRGDEYLSGQEGSTEIQ